MVLKYCKYWTSFSFDNFKIFIIDPPDVDETGIEFIRIYLNKQYLRAKNCMTIMQSGLVEMTKKGKNFEKCKGQ